LKGENVKHTVEAGESIRDHRFQELRGREGRERREGSGQFGILAIMLIMRALMAEAERAGTPRCASFHGAANTPGNETGPTMPAGTPIAPARLISWIEFTQTMETEIADGSEGILPHFTKLWHEWWGESG
jgi:hypothetical protein